MVLDEIMAATARYPTRHVTVTGGEPLAQRDAPALLTRLCDAGYLVSLETSGALDLSGVDARVSKIVDIKTPGSGEQERNLWSNLDQLGNDDEIKFVLTNEDDYEWAKTIMRQYGLPQRCAVLLSPVHGGLDPARLAEWMLRDGVQARFQMQLHKLLWGEEKGR